MQCTSDSPCEKCEESEERKGQPPRINVSHRPRWEEENANNHDATKKRSGDDGDEVDEILQRGSSRNLTLALTGTHYLRQSRFVRVCFRVEQHVNQHVRKRTIA